LSETNCTVSALFVLQSIAQIYQVDFMRTTVIVMNFPNAAKKIALTTLSNNTQIILNIDIVNGLIATQIKVVLNTKYILKHKTLVPSTFFLQNYQK